MLASMKKFLADRSGAFAIQFALMIVPLCVCTGLAIDGGRTFLARYELGQALDAAALAVGSTDPTKANLQTMAQTYVNANFKTPHRGTIGVTVGSSANGVVLNLTGNVVLDTYFMPLVGQNTVSISATSEVRRGGSSIEVTLALDVTGSMNETPTGDSMSKIEALQDAANDLIDTVVAIPANQTPFHSRVAIVPWANNVFPGSATLANTLRGTVVGTQNITATTWKNGTSQTATATWRNGASIASATVTKNAASPARVILTFSANPSTIAANDYISLQMTTNGSYGSLNQGKYKVFSKASSTPWTIVLQNADGTTYPAAPTGSVTTGVATVQECFNAACNVRITLAGAYSPTPVAGSNWIFTSFTNGGSNNYSALNTSTTVPLTTAWQAEAAAASGGPALTPAPTSTVFFLKGSNGPSFTATANGTGATAQQCFVSTENPTACAIQVTAPVTGALTTAGLSALANGDYLRLTGLTTSGSNWGGTVNNAAYDVNYTGDGGAWPIEKVSGNTFVLTGSVAPNQTVPSASGTTQCMVDGCAMITYLNKDAQADTAQRDYPYTRVYKNITNCVSERKSSHVTDWAGASAGQFLGRVYDGDTSSACNAVAARAPLGLDDDRADLHTKINALDTDGSTAGQIGIAWGGYMVSPNWSGVFSSPQAEYQPSAASTANLVRIVVFMSDGIFNTAHCGGVMSNNFGPSASDTPTVTYWEYDDRNRNCNVPTLADGSANTPFKQAQAICDQLRIDDVRVYTIGFDVGQTGTAADFMKACATNPQMAYLADNSTQLAAAFSNIANDISRLRISK